MTAPVPGTRFPESYVRNLGPSGPVVVTLPSDPTLAAGLRVAPAVIVDDSYIAPPGWVGGWVRS